MNVAIESAPTETRPLCELCGYAIEDWEELIYLCAADLIAQWELADSRDRWRHTDEQPARAIEPVSAAAQPYRTPESVVQAFWYVASLDDAD